jgi:hypothetical protein
MAKKRSANGAFPPGTLVKHQAPAGEDPEYGVVVQPESGGDDGGVDYYVACFGASLRAGQPTSAPALQRFPALSLERVEKDPRRPIWEIQRKPGFAEKVMKSRAFWAILLLFKIGVWVALIWVLIHPPSCR